MIALGDSLYFTAAYPRSRYALFKTDGSAQGTVRLRDLDEQPLGMIDAGGLLFFEDSSHLWRSDGTPQGTIQVAGAGPSGPGEPVPQGPVLVRIGQTIYFRGRDPLAGTEVMKLLINGHRRHPSDGQ